MLDQPGRFAAGGQLRIVATVALWLVFAILVYLRYGVRVRGRRVAIWTLVAFALLLFTLVSAHPFGAEGLR